MKNFTRTLGVLALVATMALATGCVTGTSTSGAGETHGLFSGGGAQATVTAGYAEIASYMVIFNLFDSGFDGYVAAVRSAEDAGQKITVVTTWILIGVKHTAYASSDSSPAVTASAQPGVATASPTTSGTTASTATPQQPVLKETYKIGDIGPAGGIIFYDKKKVTDGWRYMEAAPVDLEDAEWGLSGKDVAGIGTKIGFGKKNTELIVAALNAKGESGTAAQLCAEYTLNGYNDWFLPSKDELNTLSFELFTKRKELGRLTSGFYWSSSQYDSTQSWFKNFRASKWERTIKGAKIKVRSVRQF